MKLRAPSFEVGLAYAWLLLLASAAMVLTHQSTQSVDMIFGCALVVLIVVTLVAAGGYLVRSWRHVTRVPNRREYVIWLSFETLFFLVVLLAPFGLAFLSAEREAGLGKERVLRQELYGMRSSIEKYTWDHAVGPQRLGDLVTEGYIKQIPTDPITGRNDTWVVEWSQDQNPGIRDVHSGANKTASEGTKYRDW